MQMTVKELIKALQKLEHTHGDHCVTTRARTYASEAGFEDTEIVIECVSVAQDGEVVLHERGYTA